MLSVNIKLVAIIGVEKYSPSFSLPMSGVL